MQESESTRPVALVTGASRGIGRATAVELARNGHDVAIVARGTEGLEETAGEIESVGGRTLLHAGDLSDLGFAQATVTRTVDAWHRLDVLVNNAAWRELVTMREISVESWEKTLRVSLTVPAFLARWSAEAMHRNGQGVIINVSSMMSRQAAGIAPAYIAAKGAIESLTFELASLYAPSNIRVLTVSPGAIDTEMSRDVGEDRDSDELREFANDMIMLGRWGTAEEIARLIVALTSDAASYVTGTTIVADGGWHHQHFPASLRRRSFPGKF